MDKGKPSKGGLGLLVFWVLGVTLGIYIGDRARLETDTAALRTLDSLQTCVPKQHGPRIAPSKQVIVPERRKWL